jgi:hypothetical protein
MFIKSSSGLTVTAGSWPDGSSCLSKAFSLGCYDFKCCYPGWKLEVVGRATSDIVMIVAWRREYWVE